MFIGNIERRSFKEVKVAQRAFSAETVEEEREAILRQCSAISRDDWDQVDQLDRELKRLSPEVIADEEVALACVEVQGERLKHFRGLIRDNRRVVLAAVRNDGYALQYASNELRAEREVVLAAVCNFGQALQHASKDLQADKAVVLAAVSVDGSALKHASESLRADKEVVLAAVSKTGEALEYAKANLQADKEVMLAAVSNRGPMLQLASPELQADKDVVLAAVRNCGWALRYASGVVREDLEVVHAAVTNSGSALEHSGAKPRADKEVVLAAVSKDGSALRSAKVTFRGDREVLLAAARTNFSALKSAGPDLRADKDFLLLFARQSDEPRARACYAEAAPRLKEAICEAQFCSAAESALSIPGQAMAAPTLSVILTRTSSEGEGDFLHAEASLLSGEKLVCDLAIESREAQEQRRQQIEQQSKKYPKIRIEPGPEGLPGRLRCSPNPFGELSLGDLAKKLVELLQQQTGTSAKYIFIAFLKSDTEDPVVVTPWDHDRPLTDFLCSKP